MPTFRCTNCHRRVDSPVVIGAGDCPACGGDVVFDIRGGQPKRPDCRPPAEKHRRTLLDRLLRR
jgi:DNA-directed RNA polymerase subunit RPC12/RpoP